MESSRYMIDLVPCILWLFNNEENQFVIRLLCIFSSLKLQLSVIYVRCMFFLEMICMLIYYSTVRMQWFILWDAVYLCSVCGCCRDQMHS